MCNDRPVGDPHDRTRAGVVVVAVLGALAGAVVAWATRPVIALDDAAISFRYAERLATGQGLTYGDGAAVLGASSPLHTVLLAGLRALGVEVPSAAVLAGVVGIAVAAALVATVAGRLSGPFAAAVAVTLFLASPVRWYATGGLESATLMVACLGAVAALQARREGLAGVLLGVAVLAKLDALALVAAVGVVLVARDRRLPVRLAVAGAATVAPWLVWSAWRYGTPLPRSLVAKAGGVADAPGYEWDPTWPAVVGRRMVPAGVAGLAALAWDRDEAEAWTIRAVLALWLVLGVAAAALLPLGAPYPWYLVPATTVASVLAGDAAGRAVKRWRAAAPSPTVRLAVPAVGVVAVLALVALSAAWNLRQVIADLPPGQPPGPVELLARDLRAAGAHIEARHRGAPVRTCFGWVAFAAPSSTVIDPCGLNSLDPASSGSPADGFDVVVDDGSSPPGAGRCTVARFDGAAERWDAPAVLVYGRCPG